MEARSRFQSPAPIDKANFFSRFTFAYLASIFLQGWKHNGLDYVDIPRCPLDDQSKLLLEKADRIWKQDQNRKRPLSLWWILLRTFQKSILLNSFILLLMECFLKVAQPLLLARVIRNLAGGNDSNYLDTYLSATGVVVCTAISNSVFHFNAFNITRIGMRARAVCIALMFQKALRLSPDAMNKTAVGQIINIMSNDVDRFIQFSFLAPYLVIAPLQLIIANYIVFQYLGYASFVGIGILFLLIPFQAIMGRFCSNIRFNIARFTDIRLRFMSEIVSGIRVIKMYVWESSFAKRIAEVRRAEVRKIRHCFHIKTTNISMFFVSTRIVIFVAFITYVLFGNTLTAEDVFVTLAYLNNIRVTMALYFPQAIGYAAELAITCKRIEKFLMLEEKIEKSKSNASVETDIENGIKVNGTLSSIRVVVKPKLIVKNIFAKWNPDTNHSTLRNISVQLQPGDLLTVIGPVGSGKSSFLMTLLRELPLTSGQIEMEGSLAYASQSAWCFNDTVRNNILFGAKFDKQKYRKVVKVCALERDFRLFPFGDQTLVGEKGVSLSGGQKARITLARAVYRDSDICLLDDPLSAVDTSVAEHIFDQCITQYLKDKIRILVTHQIQFIQKTSKILVLKDGECLALGTFDQLQEMGIDFGSLLAPSEEKKAKKVKDEGYDLGLAESFRDRSRTLSSLSELEIFDYSQPHQENDEVNNIKDETLQKGSVKWRVYKEYFRAGSSCILIMMIVIFMVISQSLFHALDIFVTIWTTKNQEDQVPESEQKKDIIIYTVLVCLLLFSTVLRTFLFFHFCMSASVNLHNQIFKILLRAPVEFFDANPVGRIMNRFSRDLGVIDEMLPASAFETFLTFFCAVGIIITVSLVSWPLAVPGVILLIIAFLTRGVYIKAARDIQRFEGIARSPVYTHVSNTMNGLASIRAFGMQQSFMEQFFVYLNDHTATFFLVVGTGRGIGFLLDWIAIIYMAIISFVVVITPGIHGGYAGLAISSGLMLAGMLQWGIRQSADFENQMTSVERIVEYLDLKTEPFDEKMEKPPENWPTEGQIRFEHVFLRYPGCDNPVLKDIDCQINSGEKIGIVGRTGAGKSSLITALFRLTEPEGEIQIDNVKIKSIGLKELRRKISIIPQDPVVFTGTVRYNLDPFDEYPDEKIWSALEEVQLKAQVNSFPEKLNAPISEGGTNLSVGQRQLICLARAILKNNRILVLDEATANVDHQTDNLIQETIRTKFKHCTVLTVAHRLNTIIDCDRVMVLDAGRIIEFDRPYVLLTTHRGLFYEMCKKTGPSMMANLFQMAQVTHQQTESLRAEDDNDDFDTTTHSKL